MNVFGYAEGLRADTQLRVRAWAAAPLAIAAGWFKAMRVAQKKRATVMHAHWVVPNGVMAAAAAGGRPLVISLHGSDVFVAERHPAIGRAAGAAFRRATWITACSDDLRARAIALGAPPDRTETVPYGVDARRFAPSAERRAEVRRRYAIGDRPLVVSAGRLVSKKGFEYLITAAHQLATRTPNLRVVIAGDGDLRDHLARLAAIVPDVVTLIGNQSQDDVAALAAAADVIAVPSIHDEAGNVDGLPNFALEALASGTPVVASLVGGLPQVVSDGVSGLLVPERDAGALSSALEYLLANPESGRALGAEARASVIRNFGWSRMAERLEHAYDASRRTAPLS